MGGGGGAHLWLPHSPAPSFHFSRGSGNPRESSFSSRAGVGALGTPISRYSSLGTEG